MNNNKWNRLPKDMCAVLVSPEYFYQHSQGITVDFPKMGVQIYQVKSRLCVSTLQLERVLSEHSTGKEVAPGTLLRWLDRNDLIDPYSPAVWIASPSQLPGYTMKRSPNVRGGVATVNLLEIELADQCIVDKRWHQEIVIETIDDTKEHAASCSAQIKDINKQHFAQARESRDLKTVDKAAIQVKVAECESVRDLLTLCTTLLVSCGRADLAAMFRDRQDSLHKGSKKRKL